VLNELLTMTEMKHSKTNYSVVGSDKKRGYSIHNRIYTASVVLMFSFLLLSCAAVGEVFKAGMGFGIFMAAAIIIVIIFLVMRMGRNKNS
jgi:hypothetical protein